MANSVKKPVAKGKSSNFMEEFKSTIARVGK